MLSIVALQARTPREKAMDSVIRQHAGKSGFPGTGTVQYGIQQGGYVNIPDKRLGKTALHNAASIGNVKTIKLLFEQVPKPKLSDYIFMKDKKGLTAIHYAARNGKVQALPLLLDSLPQGLRKQGINAQDNIGMAPLHWAIKSGFKNMVKLLLAEGADINQKLKNGMTSLQIADWDPTMIELLITNVPQGQHRNAFVNAINSDKRNALHIVAIRGNARAAKKLIHYGITIYAKNFQDRTPLHEATVGGHTPMVTLLLKSIPAAQKTAFINQQSTLWGWTALHIAAKKGHLATVNVLLKHGINPSLKDRTGKTALDYAKENKHQAVVDVLKKVTK